jgi:hypothetical protein
MSKCAAYELQSERSLQASGDTCKDENLSENFGREFEDVHFLE